MFANRKSTKSIGRLKKRSDFLHVQHNGRKWIAQSMVVEVCNNEEGGIRYGLTVSKKVSKLAVFRNRLKRRLRAVACDVLPSYNHHNLDIVLIGRAAADRKPYKELQQDLHWCLKKMEILPDKESV